jgi:hypothetical protein
VSEQQAEQTSGEPGSLSAGPAVPASSDAQGQPVAASGAGSPDPAPRQGAAIAMDAAKADAAKADTPKPEAPKQTDKADAPRAPGKVLIMSSGDRNWDDRGAAAADMESEQDQGMFGKRRLAALAAVVALAAVAGALGGALATASLGHFAGEGAASDGNHVLEASVARIDADILALKASVEHTSRLSVAQFSKTSDRLDKVEKAQAEPAAKLARLSEAVDKLRAAPPVAPVPVAAAPVAAKEVTGSTSTPVAAAPAIPPKVEVARLPTVGGWTLRDAANGVALIEGRRGMLEVYAGDPVPGVGRVDAIRRQDGRWVVVTSKGLIVAR